jgi:hypothetical protein
MFFLQEAMPDTSGYMIAGYAVAFIVMGLYVFSLYLRHRNLQQDLKVLEEMEKDSLVQVKTQQPKPQSQKAAKSVTKKRAQKQP